VGKEAAHIRDATVGLGLVYSDFNHLFGGLVLLMEACDEGFHVFIKANIPIE